MTNSVANFTKASSIVFASRFYLVLGIVSFAVFFALYAFVLPATYTGGRVGFVSLKFLNFKLGLFAFLFSILLSLIIPFAVYAFRKRAQLESLCHHMHSKQKVSLRNSQSNFLTGQANQKTSATAGHEGKHMASYGAGSFFGSVLPPLLCCSPFLPSLAALAGGISPLAFRFSGLLQGFIATYEIQIYVGIAAILAYSVWQNARQVITAERQICDC